MISASPSISSYPPESKDTASILSKAEAVILSALYSYCGIVPVPV
jgi:hypothetical protein